MVRKISSVSYLLHIYIILILVMFILPYFSVEEYSIFKNTTSLLGAQNTSNAWIMNMVFILLGIAIIIESWLNLKKYWFQKALLMIFGLGLIGVAIFKHAPITEGINYNSFEDMMHSVFATIVGFSFILFAISAAFIETTNKRRIIAVLVGITAIVFSVLIFGLEDLAGLWQRLMFIVSFAWLIFFLKGIKTV